MATTATTLENEVFLGAGASATLIPESTFYIGASISTATSPTTHGGIANAQVPCTPLVLVPGLYAGCTLRCTFGGIQHHLVIKDNTDNRLLTPYKTWTNSRISCFRMILISLTI